VGFGKKAVKYYREKAKVYPLKSGPRPPAVKNVTGIPWNSLVPEDATAFKWMQEIIDYEPADAFGKELLGRLASLGIVKGQPVAPDVRMQQIFAKAAEQGIAMSRVIAYESRQPEARVYPNRVWESPFIGNSSSFDPQGYFNLEARTTFHFTADGITPAMAMQMPEGKGSRYQTTYKDGDGDYFDGNKTYKLNMPHGVRSRSTTLGPAASSRASPTRASRASSLRRPRPTPTAPSTSTLRPRGPRVSQRRTGSGRCRTKVSSSTSATTDR